MFLFDAFGDVVVLSFVVWCETGPDLPESDADLRVSCVRHCSSQTTSELSRPHHKRVHRPFYPSVFVLIVGTGGSILAICPCGEH